MGKINWGSNTYSKFIRGASTSIQKIYIGATAIWSNWTYKTGTLFSKSYSSSGSDITGASVALATPCRIVECYCSMTFKYNGSGSTSYSTQVEGYDMNAQQWVRIGIVGGVYVRPGTLTKSGTVTVSAANQERVMSHLRLTGGGGLYCYSRSISGKVTKWYEQG